MKFSTISGGEMKRTCALLIVISFVAVPVLAQEHNTEIQGFYQTYRNFSFDTGAPGFVIPPTKLNGGGFNIAQNLAPWFALWTQFSFFGSAGSPSGLSVRVINNLEGMRWQTRQYGPIRFYVKGGLGFSNYSVDISGGNIGSGTKLALTYGGGAQIWMADWIGVTLDVSQVFMGVPNITDLPQRDKWDSGLTFTPGITLRF
jgi:hypothetical protein